VSVRSKERLIDDLEKRIAETIAGTPANPLKPDAIYSLCVAVLSQQINDNLIAPDKVAIEATKFWKFYKKYSEL
jgi:hypothetical protein